MLRIIKSTISCITLAIALVSVPVVATAQPVPPQIFTAKRIFISNFGEEGSLFPGAYEDQTYNQFYRDMKSNLGGKYQLVTAPADADLVFEIHFIAPTASVSSGSAGSVQDPQFRLIIRDIKTRVVLWALTEHVRPADSHADHDKKFNQAMTNLVKRIKDLRSSACQTTGATAFGCKYD